MTQRHTIYRSSSTEYTANAEMYIHVTASTLGVSIGLNLEQVSLSDQRLNRYTRHSELHLKAQKSNPEVLFKALTLLVNLLYIFIYTYVPLP